MEKLAYILVSVIFVSIISLLGIITLSWKKKSLDRRLSLMVAFAAGSLLAAAFFDLFPESLEQAGPEKTFPLALLGIVAFFIFEKFFYWYHCHGGRCSHHSRHPVVEPVAYLNLIGDAIHNFIDGAVIAVAYLASLPTGIVATMAVIFHEIPQEIGDFAILVKAGLTRQKALALNFLTALTAILGAVLTYYFATNIEYINAYLLPFAAGNFLYIATADLIPELHKEDTTTKNLEQLISFLLGIAIIALVTSHFTG